MATQCLHSCCCHSTGCIYPGCRRKLLAFKTFRSIDADPNSNRRRLQESLPLPEPTLPVAAPVAEPAQAGEVTAKHLVSGAYTFWWDATSPDKVATTATPATDNAIKSDIHKCLGACDGDAECAGVAMTKTADDASAAITSCSLLYGKEKNMNPKHALIRAMPTRLTWTYPTGKCCSPQSCLAVNTVTCSCGETTP